MKTKNIKPSNNVLWICITLLAITFISIYFITKPKISEEQRQRMASCENQGATPRMDSSGTIMADCY